MLKFFVVFPMAFFAALPAAVFAEEQAKDHQRLRFLASRLDMQIEEMAKGDVPLPFLLETLSAHVSVSDKEREKYPEKQVRFVLNLDAFNRGIEEKDKQLKPEEKQIKFLTTHKSIPLSSLLEIICEQLEAGYVVRKDYIEILPVETIRREINHQRGADRDMRTLVVRFYDNVSAQTALSDLADRYGRTLILSPKAQKELETKISASLINVPFDVAVETLADIADLKVIHKSNVMVVTTKEQADAINDVEKKKSPDSKGPKSSPKN